MLCIGLLTIAGTSALPAQQSVAPLPGYSAAAGAAERALEAQAIARLQHPGIVQVFEIGEHEVLILVDPDQDADPVVELSKRGLFGA